MDVNTGGNLGRVADETTGEDKELIKSIKQDKARTKSDLVSRRNALKRQCNCRRTSIYTLMKRTNAGT